jgi:hypothetical protein
MVKIKIKWLNIKKGKRGLNDSTTTTTILVQLRIRFRFDSDVFS